MVPLLIWQICTSKAHCSHSTQNSPLMRKGSDCSSKASPGLADFPSTSTLVYPERFMKEASWDTLLPPHLGLRWIILTLLLPALLVMEKLKPGQPLPHGIATSFSIPPSREQCSQFCILMAIKLLIRRSMD